jgi:uncharacterized membrane protein YozB (DUF420 family)
MALAYAREVLASGTVDLLVMDEISHAIKHKLLSIVEVIDALNSSKIKATLSTGIVVTLTNGVVKVFAEQKSIPVAVNPAIKDQIIHAFDPLITLVQTLSYPIGFVMISAGCLFIMCNNREKGMQMINTAAIGYILVQLSPLFMKILVSVGSLTN